MSKKTKPIRNASATAAAPVGAARSSTDTAPAPAPAALPNRFRITLASSLHGDLVRRGAPDRLAAFAAMAELAAEAATRTSMPAETASVRIEQDVGG